MLLQDDRSQSRRENIVERCVIGSGSSDDDQPGSPSGTKLEDKPGASSGTNLENPSLSVEQAIQVFTKGVRKGKPNISDDEMKLWLARKYILPDDNAS